MSGSQSDDEDQRLVTGLSFVSFPTSDEQLYYNTVSFYTKMGFSKFQEFDQMGSSAGTDVGVKSVSTHAADSVKECWLVALPDAVFDATGNDIGASVKVRMVSSGPNKEDVEKKLEAQQNDKDFRSVSPSVVFTSKDINQIVSELKESGLVVKTSPIDAAPIEAYTFDPLGNCIGFTSRKYPTTTNDRATIEPHAETTTVSGKGVSRQPACKEKKKRVAVMTSGGDAPGMNSVVRAVVRTAIDRGCEAYAVFEGYEGLVQGGDYIKEMTWDSVRGLLAIGGTMIGTARCMSFKEREGRLTAAHNMIKAGIDALIVCGGDGSLTGADRFRTEWPSLIKELVDRGQVSQEQFNAHENLFICGTVGSIDNDMCLTDATIGAYSSLERICESIDYIFATATSHSRTFIVTTMGNHSGWLTLMAGLACGADYVYIPEQPPSAKDPFSQMKKIVHRHREKGMRRTLILVAEGATDDELNPISAEMIKDSMKDMNLDIRCSTLGHLQRGGSAVGFDRLIATLQGVRAVDEVLSLSPEMPSPMIGLAENKIISVSLQKAVSLTRSIGEHIQKKEFDQAVGLRDSEFLEHLNNYLTINGSDNEDAKDPAEKKLKIAVVAVGAPAGGMNSAIRAAACYCFSRGHRCFAIHNGMGGLSRHESVRELSWFDVEQWGVRGGCEIGTNRELPNTDMGQIAFYFQKYSFDGLIIIGGFEGFHSLHQFEQARFAYPALRIPMVCIPATISNNVPGSESSLGTDTALNSLVNYCDVIKQSASATRRRVFVVETVAGNVGYVSSYAGLVTGSVIVYTPEEGIKLKQLGSDIDFLKDCFKNDNGRNRAGRLVIRSDKASDTFDTETLRKVMESESDGLYQVKTAMPGHYVQGGSPSGMDRARAIKLCRRALSFIEEHQATREKTITQQRDMYAVIGVKSSKVIFTPVQSLWEYETELESRKSTVNHWTHLTEICDMLSGRPKVEET